MTLREKVLQECPGFIDSTCLGGVTGCPGDYAFLNDDRQFDNCGEAASRKCELCWGREYNESSEITPACEYQETDESQKNCKSYHDFVIKRKSEIMTNLSLAIEELTDTYNHLSSDGKEVELSVAIKNLSEAFRVVSETKVEQEETE